MEEMGGRLSAAECVQLVANLLAGGIDTTTAQLAHAIRLFAGHPAQWALLAADPALVSRAVDEVLRFDSPVQATSRLAWGEHLMVGDIEAPGGAVVVLLLGAANRDPSRYADPDRFDPFRKDSIPLSVGAGAHFCI